MKKSISITSYMTFLAVALFSFTGCIKDSYTKTYTIMTPVYDTKANVMNNIKSNAPTSISVPGKIYMYGNYIFLNEVDKGVHIIDNSNPSNPVNKAFINIPGNIDIAVKGNTLYADFYTDLLAIDISNPLQAKTTKLVPDIFPERQYANGFIPDSTLMIVGWNRKDTTVSVDLKEQNPWLCNRCGFMAAANDAGAGGKANSTAVGIAGSMARFAIVNDYLYAVNISSLNTIAINEAANPSPVGTTSLGWNIETIYPFKGNLFVGSSNGMHIVSIADPAKPVYVSGVSHFNACDPVVADDNYAFVTLRTGTFCAGTTNELDVVDIADLSRPQTVNVYALSNPHGLAKEGNHLFVCDGVDGLKVYDASNPVSLKLLKHLSGMETYDVIAWNKRLLLVTKGGLEQYDYTDITNIKLLSKLGIN